MTRTPFRLLAAGSLALVASTVPAPAQTRLEWTRTFGSTFAFDGLRDVAVDGAGLTWITGFGGQGSSPTTGFVCVYDAAGNTVWSGISSSPTLSVALTDIAVDPTGGVVVSGGTLDPAVLDSSRLLLQKYDSQGNLAWRSTYGAPGIHEPLFRKIVVDANGRTYAVGREKHTYSGQRTRGLVAAFSPSGRLLWTVHPKRSDHEDLFDVSIDAAGDLYLTGTSDGLYIAKITAGGTIAWQRVLPQIATHAYYTALDGAGNLFVGAARQSVSAGNTMLTAAFDVADGTLRWSHDESGPHYLNWMAGLAFSPTGELLCLARITENGVDRNDTLLVARSPSGALLRRAVHDEGLGRNEAPTQMAVAGNGDVYAVGASSNSAGTDSRQILLRFSRADAHGASWVVDQIPAVTSYGQSYLALDPAGGIVTACSFGPSFAATNVATTRLSLLAEARCLGDGSGSACPCANTSPSAFEAGCTNSLGRAGKLDWRGNPSLSNDTLELVGIDMPDASALYLQGTQLLQGGAGVAFGDGLRCAGGAVRRLGVKTNADGASNYPEPGDDAVSLRGGVMVPGTRVYQIWYRNPASFCTPAAFNLTNALQVTWIG